MLLTKYNFLYFQKFGTQSLFTPVIFQKDVNKRDTYYYIRAKGFETGLYQKCAGNVCFLIKMQYVESC